MSAAAFTCGNYFNTASVKGQAHALSLGRLFLSACFRHRTLSAGSVQAPVPAGDTASWLLYFLKSSRNVVSDVGASSKD